MNNQVIFDFSQKGYDWLPIYVGLLFLFSGLAGINREVSKKGFFYSPKFAVLLGIAVSLGSLLFQFSNRQIYQIILQNGQASVISGQIEDFHPMPKERHGQESFTINRVLFEYSDSLGVLLENGTFVKIYYTKSRQYGGQYKILRIERPTQ